VTLPPRQQWFFQLGCWAAFTAAGVHIVAHVFGTPDLSPHATVGMSMLAPDYVFAVPGPQQPTYRSVVDGLSLSLPLLLATIGAAGLAVSRHGNNDARLVRSVAGAFGIGLAALLVTSVVLFFSVLTFALALPALCFGLACVPET
jgi:hypothetical protein